MRKIIYSKFSNDRSPAYKIRTDIYEEEDKRFVVKSGIGDGGKRHIAGVFSLYIPLKEQTKDTIFDINKSTLINGDLNLEYLYGDNLEKKLDDALKEKRYDDFKGLVKTYTENVRAMAKETFEDSKEYYMVFGKDASADESKTMTVNDIDLIFANVIAEDDKWTIIDYEWSFTFKIPVDFILYRTIHYYAIPDRRKILENIDLYELMGVDKSREAVYKRMEENFQSYIINANTPLWQLYDVMGEPFYNMPEIAEKKKEEHPTAIKIYDGDKNVSSRVKTTFLDDGVIEAVIDLDDDIKSIMYCPTYQSCVLKIISVTEKKFNRDVKLEDNREAVKDAVSEEYAVQYIYNGVSYENNIVFFKDNNPYFITDDIISDMDILVVKYKLVSCGEKMSDEIKSVFDVYPECNSLREENQIIQEEKKNLLIENENDKRHIDLLKAHNEKMKLEDYQVVMELQAKLEAAESDIVALKNSTSWKITKPIRRLKGYKE